MVVVTVEGLLEVPVWEIWCDSDVTDLGTGIIVPPYNPDAGGSIEPLSVGDASLTVTRVSCPGVSTDNFDSDTLMSGTTAELLSSDREVAPVL